MTDNLFESNRRGFLAGLGAFALAPAFGAIDIAPKSTFKGEVTGRRLELAAIGCGGMGDRRHGRA